MRIYPVTRSFNKSDIIGELRLNDDVEIPLNCHFALEGLIKKSERVLNTRYIRSYELTGISLMPDLPITVEEFGDVWSPDTLQETLKRVEEDRI